MLMKIGNGSSTEREHALYSIYKNVVENRYFEDCNRKEGDLDAVLAYTAQDSSPQATV